MGDSKTFGIPEAKGFNIHVLLHVLFLSFCKYMYKAYITLIFFPANGTCTILNIVDINPPPI